MKRDGMPEKAEAIYRELKRNYHVFYDEKGAIGRRYRRQDEAGTPFCITIDSQSLTDETVTIRDRDSCRQWRVAAAGVSRAIGELLDGQAIPAAVRGMGRAKGREPVPADHSSSHTWHATLPAGRDEESPGPGPNP